MKSALLLLSVVVSPALAQPYVSEPISIATAARPVMETRLAPAMSIVPDGDGFVAAWSSGNAVYAARLNAAFVPVTPVHELRPLRGAAYEANYPNISPIDGGYALVWLERENIWQPRTATAVLCRLTAAFEPSQPIAVSPLADSGLARVAGGDANAISVLVQGNVFTVDRNGVTEMKPINSWALDDAVTPGARIAVVSREFTPENPPCPPPFIFGSACWRPATWDLKVQIDTLTFTRRFTAELAPLSIGFGADTHLVAWLADAKKPGGRIAAVRIRNRVQLDSFNSPLILGGNTSASSRPSIAWDGERFLIAWEAHGDIYGAAMTPEGQVQPFTLVATATDGLNPIVVGVKPGRFALAYEVRVDDQHRELVARTVDFKVFHRRAAR
ncbi:MAG TPA: hypothetical protein VJZ76_01540 [Thermoanaerobaculia bacterium]|nr:hypothetical protein [Thermoanaerobaculia bacterium]